MEVMKGIFGKENFTHTHTHTHTGPAPSPSPPPPKGTHYGDPYDVACLSDEINVTVTGVPGAFCSPKCT